MSAIPGRASARALAHAVALALALLACAAVKADAATVPDGFYGVNSGSNVVDDPVARAAALPVMSASGLSYVRVDASWNAIEPAPPVAGIHTYVWAKYDLFVADLARNGLRWYPAVGYSTPWNVSVAGDLFSPPAGNADYAAFAAALAQRYGSAGTFWAQHPELPKLPVSVYGIWNEPSNSTFWHGPQATPARYMSLYLAARAAIKAADPAAHVATGGLLDSGVVDANSFLRAMLDSVPVAARGQIDAVGWHPYVGDLDSILASIKRARTTLTQYGVGGVPIEISEVGWHTGWADSDRAAWLHGLAAQLPHAGLGVTRLMPYVWTGDPEWQIANLDGSLGPLGNAYVSGIRDAFAPQPAATTTGKKAKKAKKKASKRCTSPKGAKSGKKSKAAKRCAARARSAKARKAKAARARKAKAARARKAKAAKAKAAKKAKSAKPATASNSARAA